MYLERKYRREFRPYIVACIAGNPAKERQTARVRHGAISGARAVVSLLESEGHPRVIFVLNVAREEIASSANRSETPRVPLQRLIKPVVHIGCPSSVTALGIGVRDTRERKAQL